MAKPRARWSAVRAAMLGLLLGCLVSPAAAGQSLFWLQEDGTISHLGSVRNPVVDVTVGQTATLYLWLNEDSASFGFDGISLDVRLFSTNGGQAQVSMTIDEPPGRWDGAANGVTQTDSGGVGVDDANAIDLTNTDTLAGAATRFAALQITGVHDGLVRLFLCVGGMGIADGGNNAVLWFGLANNSTSPETLLIVGAGGVADACSNVPEATINVTTTYTGDFDHDNDVDLTDFAHLQECLLGSTDPQTDPACSDTLLTGDTFVDQDDVALFLECLSGPNTLPPLACQD